MHEDRRRTIKGIATIVNVSYGTEQTILTCDLNMHRVAAEFVPRLLTPELKGHRVAICQELRQRAVDDPSFRSRVITVGSMGMIPRLNNSLRNGRAQDPQDRRRRGRAAARPRAFSSCFFDIRGIVSTWICPEGQTVNTEFHWNVLRRLREDIRRKRPELWCVGNWLLHDDNAPSHRALVTQEIQRESQNVLGTLREQDFQHAFQQWQRRWDRCVAAQGDYFEGDAAQT